MGRLKDSLRKAEASGMMVAVSPVLMRAEENIENEAQPFIEAIRAGGEKVEDVCAWLRAGRARKMSRWQAEEMAEYIESETKER